MPTKGRSTDRTRASREGHWFHEAWAARKAMQLLFPIDGLIGIAVEGLSEEDQVHASAGTVEIADLTVYYGKDANFRDAEKVETLQFKYSPKQATRPFRASDAKKTIEKFAESYRDYRKNNGAAAVTKKLFFELITNRPVFPPLQQAIDGVAQGTRLTGQAKRQAEQFRAATGLTGRSLAEFARKCRINGLAGSLHGIKTDLRKILVDWSATADALARARLGDMRDLVATKAGCNAQLQKVIRQVDVLAALGLSDVTELLPCPESLATIGPEVTREQLTEAASLVPRLTKPLMVHAEGGIGKTVFLRSLASLLAQQHEIVFFDCFGGGAYRSPEDGRHLPRRGLIHIANMIACRGLCDPILPGSENPEALFGRFRERLAQCVRTLRTASRDRQLILFIDAVDNAAELADERGERAFPTSLLESIYLSGPVPGVTVIASGRTHRIRRYVTDFYYHDFELCAFTITETASYLSTRMVDVTDTEINVAQSRSEGNPRVLEHLVTSDRGLLDPSEIDSPIVLNDLLRERIDAALGAAIRQGYKQEDINAFLAGLSVLPPPVPLHEYANACGMELGAVESFAADLAPLLDRTRQGMILRDEPTETFIRTKYGADAGALRRVASNLFARQAESVYAAQALPGLLQRLGDGQGLFELAFDDRLPSAITSAVGQRRIRDARLKAAAAYAIDADDSNNLVRLLVELSAIAMSEQRGVSYIRDNPDLVVNTGDTDALRRLFESRTRWPGSRHARLTIASTLAGDLDDAFRHFTNALAWMRHDIERDSDRNYSRPTPELIDRAAIPFVRLVQGRQNDAIRFMRLWVPWYAFDITEQLLELVRQASRREPKLDRSLKIFLSALTNDIGILTGALSFCTLSDQKNRELLQRLSKACKRAAKVEFSNNRNGERPRGLADGLRKAAALAASHGMGKEGVIICQRAPHERPPIARMVDWYSDANVFAFLFGVALRAAAKGDLVHERDVLPSELWPLTRGFRRTLTGAAFGKKLKEKLQQRLKNARGREANSGQNLDGLKRQADEFLDHLVDPLLELTGALASLLGSSVGHADEPFRDLVHVWVKLATQQKEHHYDTRFSTLFRRLGIRMTTFALWARRDLKAASIRLLLEHLHQQQYLLPSTVIEVIWTIARRPRFDVIAAKQAVQAAALIERDNEVNNRSTLFAKLARAILPVSAKDAAAYFRTGLNQMDAIGSDDYEFMSELLNFAGSIKGDELSPKSFHTLTNICELNMFDDAERFPWDSFATAMSRTAGPRGLAKLSRWHDRGKVNFEYTLLPYLVALVEDEKMAPVDVLALLRLVRPIDMQTYNTETFATTMAGKASPNAKVLIEELLQQYVENNPVLLSGTTRHLAEVADEVLGKQHVVTTYLSNAQRRMASVGRHERNRTTRTSGRRKSQENLRLELREVRRIAGATDPLDEGSLNNSMSQLGGLSAVRECEGEFFRRVRARVHLGDRRRYLDLLVRVGTLDIYAKCNELAECKEAWAASSADLDVVYRSLATSLLEFHAEDFVASGGLSRYRLRRVADVTGTSVPSLTRALIKIFTTQNSDVGGAVWLGLAAIVCDDTDDGHGQNALERLLQSGPARLTSTVVDGPWQGVLYPSKDVTTIAAGLVWQLLGSPRAADRWRAAHSVRRFARLARWGVVDALASKLLSTESKTFGAQELPFFYLHARLWLLIALSRIAVDSPAQIAKYRDTLMDIALDRSHPHVLLQHFAAQAILSCYKAGVLSLGKGQREDLRTINDSPFPHSGARENYYLYADFHRGRPDGAPIPDEKFFLDYDFEKYDVHELASVFGQPGWAVGDDITEEVQRLDPSVHSMYDKAGREGHYQRGGDGLTSSVDVYGQYVAWHALSFIAARLLSQHAITEAWEWIEWHSGRLLTRNDGLWLSDGTDRRPVRTMLNVLEQRKEGSVLIGDRKRLMSLVGIDNNTVGRDLIVNGDWKSPDGIDIHIRSALVARSKGKKLAREVLDEEDAFFVWLPTLDDADDDMEYCRSKKSGYEPWIVSPTTEGNNLDRYDPLSVIAVEQRPRFMAEIGDRYSLERGDPFQRSWLMPGVGPVATTDAWGVGRSHENGGEMGVRLVCKTGFLSRVLQWKDANLVLLIKLRRYEQGGSLREHGRFSHTVAVVRVREDLKFEYLAGPVNQVKPVR